MKLNVQGIEEIEITDPAGLCNPPVPQQGMPAVVPAPMPQLPTAPGMPVNPFSPFSPRPFRPGINPVGPPPNYTRRNDPEPPTKWGVGGEMIQQAGEQVDPDKWEKNWQSKLTGEDPDGERNTHQASR